MTLRDELRDDLADAMRAGKTEHRDTLRLLLAAVKQEEVDSQRTLTDDEIQQVIAKQAKQRHESIADAERAGRQDLADEARAELVIIEEYLPEQMSREEIRAEAEAVIAETGASGMQAMGQVMSRLMPRLQGQADGRVVSEVVRDLLTSNS